MIGGEFDLSAGVAVIDLGARGVDVCLPARHERLGRRRVRAALVSRYRRPQWLVARAHRLPSFLVTLGTFLMLQGANLAMTRLVTGNVATNDISNMAGFNSARSIFASDLQRRRHLT